MSAAKKNKRIYLDNASATPIDPQVIKKMYGVLSGTFGNPSGLHQEGVEAVNSIEKSRERVASLIGALPDEIIFTSGGTEGDNLAIRGAVASALSTNKFSAKNKPHIITTAIEHAAVLETCRALEAAGIVDVTYVGVNANGIVDPKEIKKALTDRTMLVSVMYANNEIGTIQPIKEIAKEIRHFKKNKNSNFPLFHTDAVQATNHLDIFTPRLGVDLMTLNGSKIYGPKGIGALYVKRGTAIMPMMTGGDQERGLRAGTESAPLIAGFAEALLIARDEQQKESRRLAKLRDAFVKDLTTKIPNTVLNGDATIRLPNNVNVTIGGVESELLVIYLDAAGIAGSAKSACKATDPSPSHVLAAIGHDANAKEGSIRFSLGRQTTSADLKKVIVELKKILKLHQNR